LDTSYQGRVALSTIYFSMAVGFKSQGEMSYAVEAYQESLAHNPEYVMSLVNLGNTFVEMGKTDEAMVYLRRAAEGEGAEDPHVWYSGANCWARMGEGGKALEGYKIALEKLGEDGDERAKAMVERQIAKFA
jgi:Tfp pilus assembly protein PilF